MTSLLESESQSDLWWGGGTPRARAGAGVMMSNNILALCPLYSDIQTTWEDLIQAAWHRCALCPSVPSCLRTNTECSPPSLLQVLTGNLDQVGLTNISDMKNCQIEATLSEFDEY